MITGVDVSRSQPPSVCHWRQAVTHGEISFVYVKSTEGRRDSAPYLDDACIEHLSGTRRAGLFTGVYHVARPDNREAEGMDPISAGRAEGEFAAETARGLGALANGSLPLALDLERFGSWTKKQNGDFVEAFAIEFYVRADRQCAVYTGPKIYERNFEPALALRLRQRGCPLWLARPDGEDATQPSQLIDGWPWSFWQKSHTATVPGLPTPIDLNGYRGTLAELAALT